MKNTVINFDFDFFMDLIKYIFIPVLIVVLITGIAIFFYSRSIKEKDIKRYNYVVNFWSCLLAIVIIGALLAITIGFSRSLIDSMIAYDLVESNKMFYYIIMVLPIFPSVFLLLYIVKFIKVVLNKEKRPRELEDEIRQEKVIEEKQIEVPSNEIKPKEEFNDTGVLPPPNIIEKKEKGNVEELF